MKQQRTCGLEGLPSRQREAYELHLEGLTTPDIAKRMSVGNARAYELIALAKKKLNPPETAADPAKGAESKEIRTASRCRADCSSRNMVKGLMSILASASSVCCRREFPEPTDCFSIF